MPTRILTAAGLAAVLAVAALWFWGGFNDLAQWAAARQREVQNTMAGALRALRGGEPGALMALMAVAFSYGFVHAAGPGHGKVVIGGYGVARRVPIFRLSAIALAGSLAQATTAVVLVYGGVFLLDWSRDHVVALAEVQMAVIGNVLIGLVGLWLVWRGLRGVLRPREAVAAVAGHQHSDLCDHCGHRHGPSIDEVSRLTSWREAAAIVVAIAARPCTGALFLLILTWRMGLEAAGIAGVYVMGLGTAAVTVTVAAMSVLAREGTIGTAGRFAGLRTALPVLELTAGAAIAIVAFQMAVRTL
jgi:nickel/cobalt transporter (NicO) family protein